MEREQAHALCERLVVRHDEPAVAEAKEVLRRIEAVRRDRPVVRDAGRTERLCRVFDDRYAELCELDERRRPPEQMHRHERARAIGDLRCDVLGIDVERDRVDVREHRRRAALGDRLGGRVERERRTDHFVAGPDLERIQSEHEGVRAVCDADRRLDAEIGRRFVLECLVVRPADELCRIEHLAEAGLELGDQRLVLGMDVNERDRHGVSL